MLNVDRNINKKKGGTGMVDTPLLEQRIKDSGKKYGYLAEKLGISRQ